MPVGFVIPPAATSWKLLAWSQGTHKHLSPHTLDFNVNDFLVSSVIDQLEHITQGSTAPSFPHAGFCLLHAPPPPPVSVQLTFWIWFWILDVDDEPFHPLLQRCSTHSWCISYEWPDSVGLCSGVLTDGFSHCTLVLCCSKSFDWVFLETDCCARWLFRLIQQSNAYEKLVFSHPEVSAADLVRWLPMRRSCIRRFYCY